MHVISAPDPPAGGTFCDEPIPPFASPGDGTLLWLVRHGRVHADYHEVAYGCMDVPLSEDGHEDTARVGAAFAQVPLAGVRSSDLERAADMGRSISASTGAPLALDPRLREIDRGAWQGLSRDEFWRRWSAEAERFHAAPYSWKGHEGESDDDVWTRVRPALEEALADTSGGSLALTCHFNVVRVVTIRCLGWAPVRGFAFRNAPAHMTLLSADPGGWTLRGADVATPDAAL